MFLQRRNTIINDYIRANFRKIEVMSGVCRYNYHCHSNAVHDALNENHEQIALCIFFDEGTPTVHFINVTTGGNFEDNTLGRWSERMEYYFIRYIGKQEFFDVYKIHGSLRRDIKQRLPFWLRLFHNEKSI